MRHPPADLLRPETWAKVLNAVDQAVADDPASGFTTFVGFIISGGRLCGTSSGDSAVLLLNPTKPATILTARQYKNPPVGSGGVECVSFAATLVCPWKVLAMTDGVWKYVGWEKVVAIAIEGHGQGTINALLDRARLPRTGGLQDDFSIVLVEDAESESRIVTAIT